jgi:hypothetical protein
MNKVHAPVVGPALALEGIGMLAALIALGIAVALGSLAFELE